MKKGHTEELEALARALREGGPWPIPLEQQLQATRISFAVERQLTGPTPANEQLAPESVSRRAAREHAWASEGDASGFDDPERITAVIRDEHAGRSQT